MKGKLTETDKVLISLLQQNTGRHYLDSGDYYGRHWERNQFRAFIEEYPTYRIETYQDGSAEVLFYIPLFLYLRNRLEYDPAKDALVQEFWDSIDEYPDWEEDFLKFLLKKNPGWEYIIGENSYHSESFSALDQGFQYEVFHRNEKRDGVTYYDPLLILQIHGGSDIRGGYTQPVGFVPYDAEGLSGPLSKFGCHNCGWSWETEIGSLDIGKHDSYVYEDGDMRTEDFKVEMTEDPPEKVLKIARKEAGPLNTAMLVDSLGQGYCPICGEPLVYQAEGSCSIYRDHDPGFDEDNDAEG